MELLKQGKVLIYKLLDRCDQHHIRSIHSFIHSTNICWASVGKESACNAGDPGSIPGLGRSAGEGICYPLQYSWASLVAQLVKNLLAMQETWVQSLGWEDPLEKGTATHSSILISRIPWTVSSMTLQRIGHDWAAFTFTICHRPCLEPGREPQTSQRWFLLSSSFLRLYIKAEDTESVGAQLALNLTSDTRHKPPEFD